LSTQIGLRQLNLAGFNWRAAAGWLGVFISFPIAGLAAQALVGSVDNVLDGLAGGAVAGMVIGLAQWLVLRRTHRAKAAWIGATSLGMGAGLALAVALFGSATSQEQIIMRALVTGGLMGLAQGVMWGKGRAIAALWTLIVAGTFTASWIVTGGVIGKSLSNGYTIFGSSGALLFQLITGLVILLALPAAVEPASPAAVKD
jgi:hypothetical protein